MDSVPCYRTGGAVRVPPRAKEKIKRRIKLNRYNSCLILLLLSLPSPSLFYLSYQRYKEETVEELSVESAPTLANFVMAETDRVTKVRCFYNSFSLCVMLFMYHHHHHFLPWRCFRVTAGYTQFIFLSRQRWLF